MASANGTATDVLSVPLGQHAIEGLVLASMRERCDGFRIPSLTASDTQFCLGHAVSPRRSEHSLTTRLDRMYETGFYPFLGCVRTRSIERPRNTKPHCGSGTTNCVTSMMYAPVLSA